MTNRMLPISLLISAAVAVPSLAMAAPVNQSDIQPADMRTMPVDNTLQAEVEGPDGELLATQPGAVDDNDMDAMNAVDMAYEEDDMAYEDDMDNDMPAAAEMQKRAAQERADYEKMAQARAAELQAREAQVRTAMMNMDDSVQSNQVTPADMREKPADITLQEKKKDRRGELLATQPGQVEFNENRRFTIR